MSRIQINRAGVAAAGLSLALVLPVLADPGAARGGHGCPMSRMEGPGMQGRMQGQMSGMQRGGMQGCGMQLGGMMHGGVRQHGGMEQGKMQQGGMMQGGMMQGGMMQGGMMRGGMMHGGMRQGRMQHGGMPQHGGQEGMPGNMGSNMADMQQVHTLLANHASIQRRVRKLPNGVETVTTSSDPRIAALLPEHVNAMYARLKDGRLIRGFDPLFVELFRQADKIEMKVERLKDGVRVVETATDPYAVKLIQAHADAVDGFAKDGMAAMHRTHAVPSRPTAERR